MLTTGKYLYYNSDIVKATKQQLPTEKDLRKTSRDLLRVYKFAFDNPEKKLITSRQFGKILNLSGRALGGVLAGSQKSKHIPIIVRQGMVKTSWAGKYESREQLWSINPQLPKETSEMIKKVLNEMLLEE